MREHGVESVRQGGFEMRLSQEPKAPPYAASPVHRLEPVQVDRLASAEEIRRRRELDAKIEEAYQFAHVEGFPPSLDLDAYEALPPPKDA